MTSHTRGDNVERTQRTEPSPANRLTNEAVRGAWSSEAANTKNAGMTDHSSVGVAANTKIAGMTDHSSVVEAANTNNVGTTDHTSVRGQGLNSNRGTFVISDPGEYAQARGGAGKTNSVPHKGNEGSVRPDKTQHQTGAGGAAEPGGHASRPGERPVPGKGEEGSHRPEKIFPRKDVHDNGRLPHSEAPHANRPGKGDEGTARPVKRQHN